MRKVAIIGASYLQLPLIEKAKQMGYETHVFAWQCDDVGEKEADFFYPISIIEKDEILMKCIEIGIDAICSIASDLATLTVNYVANKMQLTGNNLECTRNCTNKYNMRTCFLKRNDPSPKYVLIRNPEDLFKSDFSFPVIVKPSDRSGSRGITKLDSKEGLQEAYQQACEESIEKEVLIEEFVEGIEYSVECISHQGKHYYLATTLKHTTGSPHFIETGHEEPSGLDEDMINKIKDVVFHALDTLGIENGASHSELKIDASNNIKIIEIGARMGGDCIGSHLVQYSTGYDYIKMVIDIALGKQPSFDKVNEEMAVEIRYIMNTEDYEEMIEEEKSNPSNILYKSVIDKDMAHEVRNSSNRIGCYLIKKESNI